ncbi:MAG: hypothetical protein ACJAWQ_002720 [Paraglaciecola sp.]|jgi:hypothetical protein|uniref:hypothetical protein n=1 Tax=Psychromonas sp. TaxID=1884585 RepID=UPI0025FCE07D|nr:hypothetical protein [uncultured Paraglaciecola sp.]
MEDLGFVFGIIGMSMGISGFVFAIVTMRKLDNLESKLKELDVLNSNFKSN